MTIIDGVGDNMPKKKLKEWVGRFLRATDMAFFSRVI